MKLPPLSQGRFVQRENRFRVAVEVRDEIVAAHLPNSGRLTELLTPGKACWLTPFDDPRRKTRFDLSLVAHAGVFVSVDARRPNGLLLEALSERRLAPFADYGAIGREVAHGSSRLDFRLTGRPGACWIEAKSVTLVAVLPQRRFDIPGVLRVLVVSRSDRGAQPWSLCLCESPDSLLFGPRVLTRAWPHAPASPRASSVVCSYLAAALREAERSGVGIYAWSCQVTTHEIVIERELPVDLSLAIG